MSAAKVNNDGKVTILDGRASASEVVTDADVQDPPKLARLLGRLLANVAQLARAHTPRRLDFEDVTCAGSGAAIRLRHGFGGRVRWWPVDYLSTGTPAAPILERGAATDANVLVLLSYTTGTVSIRVEEAG